MDKELEQQAIQTFATVPEIYQQAFREAGADFPDELVGEIKKDPNQAISLLESNKDLKSAVVNIYKQNKDAILQYMQQNTSMFREGGKFDYLNKLQKGGQISRKEMFEQAKINKGLNRSQAKKAYRNSRRAGLDRDAARLAVVGETPAVEESAILERPNLINNVSAPIKVSPPIDNLIVQREVITERPTTDYSNIDFGVFNFNDAFGRASKAGLKEFTWNGKKFTTNRALPALGPDGKNYSIGDTLLQNGNVSAPDWWISKQFEPTTVLSGNGINPWPTIHAREIHPPLKREGGKLSKENEANKKYIKASEKAGQEASKKMSDLKNKHKAKLKKIK